MNMFNVVVIVALIICLNSAKSREISSSFYVKETNATYPGSYTPTEHQSLEIHSECCEPQSPNVVPIPANSNFGQCCGFNIMMVSQEVTWMEAHLQCKKFGMELVSVETKGKYDCLIKVIESSGKSNVQSFWTAGNDIFRENSFTWVTTGTLITVFFPGNTDEPNKYEGGENCVSLFKNKNVATHIMNDARCQYAYQYICQTSI